MNKEVEKQDKWIIKIQKTLNKKVNQEEAQKIWNQFDRFCLYDDLKDLHSKVIPEIAKFENKIINHNLSIEKQNLIL